MNSSLDVHAAEEDHDDLASTLHQLRRIGSTLVKTAADVELNDSSQSSRVVTPLRHRSEGSVFTTVDVSPDATARWRQNVVGSSSPRGAASPASARSRGQGSQQRSSPEPARLDRPRLQLVKLKTSDSAASAAPKLSDAAASRSARGGRSASLVSSLIDGSVDSVTSRRVSVSVRDPTNMTDIGRISRRASFAPSGSRAGSRASRRTSQVRLDITIRRDGHDSDKLNNASATTGGGGGVSTTTDVNLARQATACRRASTSSTYREYTERQLEMQPALRRLRNVQSKVHMAESLLYDALANTSDHPPRSAEERRREAVELEKAKLVLFVGRKYNVEERITALLSVIDEQHKAAVRTATRPLSAADRSRHAQQTRQVLETMQELDALVLDDNAHSAGGGGGSGRKADHTAAGHQTSQSPLATAESNTKKRTNAMTAAALSTTSTVGSSSGPVALSDNFNPSRLRRILEKFAVELEAVERRVEPGAEECVMRMRQAIHDDTSSNFKDMCWLIESLDSIFLSDDPAAQAEAATTTATGGAPPSTTTVSHARRQQSTSAARSIMSPSNRRCASAPEGSHSRVAANARPSFFLTGTDGVLEEKAVAPLSPPSHLSSTDPSLVPFSLYGSEIELGLDGVVTSSASAANQRRSSPARRRRSHLQHLHLLGFMADAVPDSYIEAVDAQKVLLGNRPTTAPATSPLGGASRGPEAFSSHAPHDALTANKNGPLSDTALFGKDGAPKDDTDGDPTGQSSSSAPHSGATTAYGTVSAAGSGTAQSETTASQTRQPRTPHTRTGAAGSRPSSGTAVPLPPLSLAHMRHDLLADLKRLYQLYNYDSLVTHRREEVVDANTKSQDDYVAEMEAKLQQQMEKRQQALAAAAAARRPDEYGLSSLATHPSSSKGRPETAKSLASRRSPGSAQPLRSQADSDNDLTRRERDVDALPPVDVLVLDSDDETDGFDAQTGASRRRSHADDVVEGGHEDDEATNAAALMDKAAQSNTDRYVVHQARLRDGGVTFTLFGEYAPGAAPAAATTLSQSTKKAPLVFAQYLLQVQNDTNEPIEAAVTVLTNKLKTVEVESAWPGVRRSGLVYGVRVPPSCVRRLLTLVPDAKATAAAKKAAKAKKVKKGHAKVATAVSVAPPPTSAFVFDSFPVDGNAEDNGGAEAPDAAYSPLAAVGKRTVFGDSASGLDGEDEDDLHSEAPSTQKRIVPKPAPKATATLKPPTAPVKETAKASAKTNAKPVKATRPSPTPSPVLCPPPDEAPDRADDMVTPPHTAQNASAAVDADALGTTDEELLKASPLQQFVFPVEAPAVEAWGVAHPDATVEAMENNCVAVSVLQAGALASPHRYPLSATTTYDDSADPQGEGEERKRRVPREDPGTQAVLSVLDAFDLPTTDLDMDGEKKNTPAADTRTVAQAPSSDAGRFSASEANMTLTPDAIATAVMAQLAHDTLRDAHEREAEANEVAGTGASSRRTPPLGLQNSVLPTTQNHPSQSAASASDVAEKLVAALSQSVERSRRSLSSTGADSAVGGWLPSPAIVLSSSSSHPLVSLEHVRPYGTVAGVQFDPDVAQEDESRRQQTAASTGRDVKPMPAMRPPLSRPTSGSTHQTLEGNGMHNSGGVYASEIVVGDTAALATASEDHLTSLPALTEAKPLASGAPGAARTPTPASTSLPAVVPPSRREKAQKSPVVKSHARVPPSLPASRYELTAPTDRGDDDDAEVIKNLLRGPSAPPPIVTTRSADTGAVNVFLPPDAEQMGLYDALVKSGKSARDKTHADRTKKRVNADRAKQKKGPRPRGAPRGGVGDAGGDGADDTTQRPDDEDDDETMSSADEPAFVSNVKNFLHNVAHTAGSVKGGGGGGGGGGSRLISVPVTAAVAGAMTAASAAPVFSEMRYLEAQAHELYRQDPLRYDTVMDDLIKKAMEQMKEVEREDRMATSHARGALPSVSNRHHSTMTATHSSPTAAEARHTMPMTSITFDIEHGGQLDEHNRRSIGGKRSLVLSHLGSIVHMENSSTLNSASPSIYPRGSHRASSRYNATDKSDDSALLQRVSAVDLTSEARKGGVANVDASKDEVQSILYEQMKAKLMLRAIIAQMQTLWAKKEAEKDARAKEMMRNTFERAADISWQFEKRRIVNLHKLIHLLDRHVGRVHGWIPMYNDLNVLTDARGFTEPNADEVTSYSTRYAATYSFTTLDGFSLGRSALVLCAPQYRLRQAMCLAKRRRLLPVRLLRQQVGEEWNRHLLFGYKKHALATEAGDQMRRSRGGHAEHSVAPQFRDMTTTGERLRYRRRLQGAAPFQSSSKMYSPRLKRDHDLPSTK